MPYLGRYMIVICTNDKYEFIIDMFDSVKAMSIALKKTMPNCINSLWKIRHGKCSCVTYNERKVKCELIDMSSFDTETEEQANEVC